MAYLLRATIKLTVLLIGMFLLLGSLNATAFDPLNQACAGIQGNSDVCDESAQQGTANPISGQDGVIAKIGRVIAILVGVTSVIMIIYGGYIFVTAGGSPVGQRSGDASRIGKAKSTIAYAIVGLAVAALAWTIITFVTGRLLP